ncbi:MAG: ATP-binding cassette domain-containing protein, partial [Lachnospiraceae bacterium]|nr:ATP-binding cassette domain-containing protein [Lachnospiraceae bacterium]
MIKAENVSKQFIRNVRNDEKGKASFKRRTKEEFLAVNGVSLEAKEGEILGILGPNGAGKTTLLRMLSCIMEPTDGNIEIYDRDSNPITDMV